MGNWPLTPSFGCAWEKVGESTGSTKINLNFSNFSAVLVVVKLPAGSYDIAFSAIIPTAFSSESIIDNLALVQMGGYSSMSAQVYIDYSANQIWIGDVRNINNASVLSTSTMIVYAQ